MAALTRPLFLAVSSALLFGLSGTASAQAVDLKPNMRPAEAFDVQMLGTSKLLFSTFSYNIGDGPLEIRGGDIGNGVQNVEQVVYRSDGTSYTRRAGTYVYHAAHDHIHFDNYAVYTLQPVNAPGASAREGHKTTFCLMDTDKAPSPYDSLGRDLPTYTQCLGTVQGISVGWGDKYGYWLADQDIDVTGLPSGDYTLTIEIDPNNHVLETNDTDNKSMIYVNLDMVNYVATVIDEPGGPNEPPAAPVQITSVSPDQGRKNDQVNVTITGSGFAEGMPVYFENGQGPQPDITVISVDGTSIKAVVSTGKGGPKRDLTWDLRVGSGHKSNAFTVTP